MELPQFITENIRQKTTEKYANEETMEALRSADYLNKQKIFIAQELTKQMKNLTESNQGPKSRYISDWLNSSGRRAIEIARHKAGDPEKLPLPQDLPFQHFPVRNVDIELERNCLRKEWADWQKEEIGQNNEVEERVEHH